MAHNNQGYKHTEESKLKISKPGSKNPMYGKSHTENTKAKMSEKKNKYIFFYIYFLILKLKFDLFLFYKKKEY